MRKLLLRNRQSPGDIVMLTAAVRDLHLSNPGLFQTDVDTTAIGIWENNPFITKLDRSDPDIEIVDCHYPLIHESNEGPWHFTHAFHQYLEGVLGVRVRPTRIKGDIYLSDAERAAHRQVDEYGLKGASYWVIVAGGKRDFTSKIWSHTRFQQVVDRLLGRVKFVQVGEWGHDHPPLNHVLDLRWKTSIREFIRLIYHADGVVCPVTFAMHLAAAVPTKPGARRNRPCVVIAGGREPPHWEAYPQHQFLHTAGMLPCCENGGCWKSRVRPIGDGSIHDRSLCQYPVTDTGGQIIPRCLSMITPEKVIAAIEGYLEWDRVVAVETRSVVPPGFIEMATNFVLATKRDIENGFERVSEDEYEMRLRACRNCEHWEEEARLGLGRCRKCGCTRLKHRRKSERCPIGKW